MTKFMDVAYGERTSFTYTLLPCDENEPFKEFTLAVPKTLEENIGCLTAALNAHYKRVAPIGGEKQKQAVMDSVKAQLQQNTPNAAPPDEQILSSLAQSQTVDIIQLLPPVKQTNYVGVTMYVDDKGQSKGSAHNARASQICAACGMPTQVVGDAFLARAFDDQDGFERQDLKINELSSDAAWVQQAYKFNSARENADPSVAKAKMQTLTQNARPPPPPPKLPLSERLASASISKAAGTESFKQGSIEEAVSKYAEAIDLLGSPEGVVAGGGKRTPQQRALDVTYGAVDVTGQALDVTDADDGSSKMETGDNAGSSSGSEKEAFAQATELLVTCLVNVAMCHLRLERPYEAIEAADHALKLDENNGKAWYRRGQACMALSQFGAAKKNLSRAATLMPKSREVREELTKCQQLAAEKRATAFMDVG